MSAAAPTRRPLLIALATALAAAVAVVAVLLTRGDDAPVGNGAAARETAAQPAPAPEEPGPVVLVPGYGGVTAGLEPLAGLLRSAGRDVTVMPLPDDGTGDLREAAAALDAAAEAALERTGGTSVDVVGFSAGGLVARLWIADGDADVARRVVTLGAPHHGTRLAGLAGAFAADRCTPACRQMIPENDLLAGLNVDETPDGVDWVSIWTTQDSVVTPPESARLDGALNLPVQSVCAGAVVSHQQLLSDPVVQAIVVEQLTAEEPVPLTAADCGRLGG